MHLESHCIKLYSRLLWCLWTEAQTPSLIPINLFSLLLLAVVTPVVFFHPSRPHHLRSPSHVNMTPSHYEMIKMAPQ